MLLTTRDLLLTNAEQSGTTTATYTYGNALIRKDGETPLYDGLGSARAETNSSQSVTFTLIPDAFGNTVSTTGSTGSSYGFAATSGYRTDGDAGLMKVGARYYDPQVGSFATRDTYLDQKPYLYCEHDPVNGVDPSGHLTKGEFWGAVTAVAVGALIVTAVATGVALIVATGGTAAPIALGVIGAVGEVGTGTIVAGQIGLGVVSGAAGGIAKSQIDRDGHMGRDVIGGGIIGGVTGPLRFFARPVLKLIFTGG